MPKENEDTIEVTATYKITLTLNEDELCYLKSLVQNPTTSPETPDIAKFRAKVWDLINSMGVKQ